MTKDEALRMALEALEECRRDPRLKYEHSTYDKTITAIKEALAQPEQEPVGQLLEDAFGRGQVMWFNKPEDKSLLYTTPPQCKPLTDDRAAFKEYIEECDKCAIVPDVAGAFNAGWLAAHGTKEKNT